MDAALSDRPTVVVTCVHGTWARGSRWPGVEEAVRLALAGDPAAGDAARSLPGSASIEFRYFEWSDHNSLKDRTRAAANLRRALEEVSRSPHDVHLLIAHSHGANIVLHALAGVDRRVTGAIGGIVFLSPPLLTSELVDNHAGVANRLLLGAVAAIPLLLAAWASIAVWIGLHRWTTILLSLPIVAGWLTLFRPATVRRRAETLTTHLALPKIDFPGLIIRASGDEAALAFSSIGMFEQLARFVRLRILGARPFDAGPDRRLQSARSWRELARTFWEALILVPISASFAQHLHGAAQHRQWALTTVLLPVVIVCATGALATVGGAMLLLLLLPASSFLLWPFGIFPTAAAALLSVSVEPSPTPAWRVVQLPRRRASESGGWRHSTYRNRAALDALRAYVRDSLPAAGWRAGSACGCASTAGENIGA